MNGHTVRSLAVIASATLVAASANATPRSGEGSPAHYLVAAESLYAWHAGAYVRGHERTVEQDGFESSVDTSRAMVYVGRDVFSWLGLYGTVGLADFDGDGSDDGQSATEYGGGLWVNLLDHDTFEFLETVQRFRVQGMLQYTLFSADDVTWGELAGNLTFGLTHEVIGSKFFWPEAYTLYAGPAVNVVNSDEYDQSSDDMVGLAVGLDVQINARTSMGVMAEIYDDDEAMSGSVSVRF